MKQEDLATAVGTDQPTVSKWERGIIRPSLEYLRAVERATGRPPGFVFVAAGLVELPQSTEDAIAMDTRLSDAAKDSVLAVLETMSRHQ
jgi:transcriptional regulator with XRE-family HTH domain